MDDSGEHDETDVFRAIGESGARALLIGRKAMIALGLPVGTFDTDLWIHIDDIEKLNAAMARIDHFPNRTPEEARARGRYVLENSEHIDVMVARASTTKDETPLSFDEAWSRRQVIPFLDTHIDLPAIEDLILTKKWAMRAKDIGDIQLLEALRRETLKGAP